jgi:hypothetical protein
MIYYSVLSHTLKEIRDNTSRIRGNVCRIERKTCAHFESDDINCSKDSDDLLYSVFEGKVSMDLFLIKQYQLCFL